MTRPTDDLLAGLGPHLIAPKERGWADALAALLGAVRRAMSGPSISVSLRAGAPVDPGGDWARLVDSAHASMRLHALLPLPAALAELQVFPPGSVADCAFALVCPVPTDHRATQRAVLEADDASELACRLAALRCAERLGLWPDQPLEPAMEGSAWVAKAAFRRTAFSDPAGRTVSSVHAVRDGGDDPARAVAWALAFPAILRLCGIPGTARLDEFHRDHARDRGALAAATARVRAIAERP